MMHTGAKVIRVKNQIILEIGALFENTFTVKDTVGLIEEKWRQKYLYAHCYEINHLEDGLPTLLKACQGFRYCLLMKQVQEKG